MKFDQTFKDTGQQGSTSQCLLPLIQCMAVKTMQNATIATDHEQNNFVAISTTNYSSYLT